VVEGCASRWRPPICITAAPLLCGEAAFQLQNLWRRHACTATGAIDQAIC
jgi:hypothetical protein